jgi:predicted Zn-dependent protease
MQRTALVFALALPWATGFAQNFSLPDIGDPSREVLAASEEVRLGLETFQELVRRGMVLEDPFLQDFIDSVGQRIALYAQIDTGSFTFFVVNDPQINAFALPGGYIGVNAGLITASRRESELAGVLAHEAAHVSQRHIARWLEDSKRSRIPMVASLLAAALLASAGGDAGQAALTGVLAADAQRQINFTRRHEQEADRVGVDLLLRSGYDPYGMPDFFERLAQTTRLYGSNIPELLRTHPVESNRIAETRTRIESLTRTPPRSSDSLAYFLAQARVQALSSRDAESSIDAFRQHLSDGNNRSALGQRYGLALSLQRAAKLDAAAAEANKLLAQEPEMLPFVILAAEIALQDRREKDARSLYQLANSLYPGDYSAAMSYGDALIVMGEPKQAMDMLQPKLNVPPTRTAILALYARAAQAAGRFSESHATMADYYELRGSPTQAIQQLELALRAPDLAPYTRQKLHAQLERLRAEVLEAESN